MKKYILIKTGVLALFAMALFTFVSAGKTKSADLKSAQAIVEDIPTIQGFIDVPVANEDLQKIVNAGINSQSAMNGQPWHFSVVTNKAVMDDISQKMKSGMPKMGPGVPGKGPDKMPPAPDGKLPPPPAPDGKTPKAAVGDSPVAIVISAKDGSEFDAGLATELMAVEANLLGYGAKIISSPTIVLNGENKEHFKKILGIPSDMNAKAVLLIGKYDQKNLDAVTGATTRKDKSEVVTFVK